jgi:hypothetical protein
MWQQGNGFPNLRLQRGATGGNMPYQSLAEAGDAVGRTRSAILKAIRRGAISATRDEVSGNWLIEPAELHRVFPAVLPSVSKRTSGNGQETRETTEDTGELRGELRELRARLDAAEAAIRFRDETLADMRRRLDAEAEERRRLTAILADQRAAPGPPKRWWRFGR